MKNFKLIYEEYMSKHTMGTIGFIIDIAIVIVAFSLLVYFAYKLLKKNVVFYVASAYVIASLISIVLDLEYTKWVLLGSFVVLIITVINAQSSELRHGMRSSYTSKVTKQYITSQDSKTELINTLIKTVEYFSSRKIGAIITIEEENNLNMYIQKAVRLDAEVTFELLETIFHPNTALHDGAVIIRGNRIMCASAFYTPSDKFDIPQHYGSRHRAAIGISEDSDAFTLVVSEETGSISTTIGGTITSNLSSEALRQSLNQHIIVK